ncbi:MAG: molybdopterin molybdenumtransferase MoeA, partial [Natronomonas sp.]|nr:molybdopterin molybdenumtransferase MoeA [Natronomonas sp.]
MTDLRTAGFKERTRVADARESLLDVPPIDRTERLSLSVADGRVIAEPVDALRDVPHYARAAMDGWAVRAEDTFGASGRSPAILRPDETIGPNRAVRVHTGSELPDGADAVVMIEETERIGDELEVFDAVGEGENVGPIGEDVEAGQRLY